MPTKQTIQVRRYNTLMFKQIRGLRLTEEETKEMRTLTKKLGFAEPD